jgi:MoxR-like ATPase
MRRYVTDIDPVHVKFAATRAELAAALIERDDEIDVVLTALIAQEHALLIGQPGTAKSLLLDALLTWTGGRKFSILLTKFSVPEEVFGPVSVIGLKEDRYARITTGRLPEADFAFVDEIFKSSSAILNTLLKLLNERVYDRGDGVARPVPLKLCVAASNEWPSPETGKELAALFDRFVLRKSVRPILSAASRKRLLWNRDHSPKLSTAITSAEIEQSHTTALALPWSDDGKAALEAVLKELTKEGVQPGDRRQFKAVAVAQAFAWLNGAFQVEPEHLEILQHVLWDDPIEQPEKAAQVIAKIANPIGMRVTQMLLEAEQILGTTEVANLAQAATAAAKLGEIDKQLGTLKGNGRVERARSYVREQVRKIKLASIEAI